MAYSATAGAALLLAPAANAQTFNITSFRENNYNHPGGFTSSPPALSGANFNTFTAATGAQNRAFEFLIYGHHSNNTHGFRLLPLNLNKLGQSRSSRAGFLDFKFADHAVVAHGAPSFGTHGSIIALRNTNPSNHNIYNFGNFVPAGGNAHKSGYIGFKTANNDYGWLKIQVTNDGGGNPSTLSFVEASDGLYGQIGDSSTITDGVSAIPEPANVAGGLGLLALGAAGVREMRRRRAVAA